MAKFTNNTPGARGVLLASGAQKLVEAGQSVEIDDKDVTKPHPDLETDWKAPADAEGPPKPKLPGLTGKSKDDLLAIAAAEGVDTFTGDDGAAKPIADGTKNDIVAAIEAKRDPA